MRLKVEMADHEYPEMPVYPLYREPEDVICDLLEEVIENQEKIIELLDKEQ